jgi:hypothetical protein
VSLLERIRRIFRPALGPDHPLSAQERDEDRPATSFDARARVEEELVGDDFDPDADR